MKRGARKNATFSSSAASASSAGGGASGLFRRAAAAGKNATIAAVGKVADSSSNAGGRRRKRDLVLGAVVGESGGGTRPAPLEDSVAANLSDGAHVHLELPVEYWRERVGKWTEGASVSVNENDKVVAVSLPGEPATTSRLKIDAHLRVEHSTPLAKDFNLVLGDGKTRHRVAVYGEWEAQRLVNVLRKAGATIVTKRSLPPCLPPRPRSSAPAGGNPKPPKRPLRPISEGEVLRLDREAKEREEEGVEMRMPSANERRKRSMLIRRKSTGSDAESPDKTSPLTVPAGKLHFLPRSNSLTVKAGEEEEEACSRGLSTGETRRSWRKQRSDQSLNSDEVSSNGNEGTSADAGSSVGSRLSLASNADSVKSATSDTDGENVDGNVHGRGNRRRRHRHNNGDDDKTRPVEYHRSTRDNDRLERFKFLLLDIEDDGDALDPGAFGDSGEMVSLDFDDYPDAVFDVDNASSLGGETSPADLSGSAGKAWIRRSFEELDLDVSATEHDERRRSTLVDPAMPPTRESPSASGRKRPPRLSRLHSVSMMDVSPSAAAGSSPSSTPSAPKRMTSTPPPPPRPPRKDLKTRRPLFSDGSSSEGAESRRPAV